MKKGDKFGKLTYNGEYEIRLTGKTKPRNRYFMKCICDCGNIVYVVKDALKKHTKSCGCLQKEYAVKHAKELSKNKIGSGNKIKCSICGREINRSKGVAERNEYNYCSRKCMAKDYENRLDGANHPLYIEDRSLITSKNRQDPRYKKWRKSVFKRDYWTCVCCGYKGDNINAHHLKSFNRFPELQFEISNGITLCINCHKEFHNLYGTRKFTSDDFYEFLKEKKEVNNE